MATDGLSLVGFFTDQQLALNHLRLDCVPPDRSEPALIASWRAAQANIGQPLNQTIAIPMPLPADSEPHMEQLLAQPWLADRLLELDAVQSEMGMPPSTFEYVPIDDLLAYQFVVDLDRSNHHCAKLSRPPTLAELLNLGLPIVQPHEDYFMPPITPFSTSAIIKLRNHNLMMHRWGVFDGAHGEKVAGVSFYVGLPFVHVTQFNGKCYLHNGYHRTYGAKLAGATHVPCIFRQVSNAQAAGVWGHERGTFPEALFASANPPTIAHYTCGRAKAVRLREKSRVIHVTWHQYSVPDEYD
jgi:hypothetical protein